MSNTTTKPTRTSTKDAALRQLGVASKKQLRSVSPRVEFVEVRAGRQLTTTGSYLRTVVVAVTGFALVRDENATVHRLEAPFVIDRWAADDRRISPITVVSESPMALLLIDVRERDAAFAAIPRLAALSEQTLQHLHGPGSEASSDRTALDIAAHT